MAASIADAAGDATCNRGWASCWDKRDTCAKALFADGRSEINCTSDGKRTFRSCCGQRARDKTCRHGRATGSGVCEFRWSSAQRSRQVCKLRCNRQRSWWIVEHKNWSTCYHTHTHTNAVDLNPSRENEVHMLLKSQFKLVHPTGKTAHAIS